MNELPTVQVSYGALVDLLAEIQYGFTSDAPTSQVERAATQRAVAAMLTGGLHGPRYASCFNRIGTLCQGTEVAGTIAIDLMREYGSAAGSALTGRRRQIAQEVATDRGVSMSDLVDLSLGHYIDQNGTPAQRQENAGIWKAQDEDGAAAPAASAPVPGHWLVSWSVDVNQEQAPDPLSAARKAWQLVRGTDSTASVFTVSAAGVAPTEVDLMESAGDQS